MKKLTNYKRSSLLFRHNRDEEKSFIEFAPVKKVKEIFLKVFSASKSNLIKLFTNFCNKLECLSLRSIINHATILN
jgi:hypothetical protein